jgi:hypothetical protein
MIQRLTFSPCHVVSTASRHQAPNSDIFSLSLFFRKGIDYFITYPPLSATRSEGFNCGYAPWRKIIFNDKFSKTYERKGGFHEKRTFCLHTHGCCGGDVGLRQQKQLNRAKK